MKEKVLIIDNQYLANIIYYKKLCSYKYVIIEQYDEHQKKSFANRAEIAGANGRINLSIPLEKGRSQKSISKDLRIWNAEKWQLRHWRSIVSSYNNSPWFKYYSDDLSVLFFTRFEFLLDWNLACLDWTIRILKLDINYSLSGEWVETVSPGISDMRSIILPGKLPAESVTRYPQVFENKIGFQSDLSILDLLFCEGPKGSLALLAGEG